VQGVLGTAGCAPTRESRNTQPTELRFRAMHATDGRWDALRSSGCELTLRRAVTSRGAVDEATARDPHSRPMDDWNQVSGAIRASGGNTRGKTIVS
jgi:hypothetical protein